MLFRFAKKTALRRLSKLLPAEPPQEKPKRRRTALDGLGGKDEGPSVGADPGPADSPAAPSAGDTGEWDGDGSAPTTNP